MKPDYTPGDEVRKTSSTGGQKGQKSARLGGADPLALMELARIYGFGEEKYDRYNYLKGYPFSLSIDAMLRHLMAFIAGEDRDPESGLLHTAHVAWHGLTLTSFLLRDIASIDASFDDRPPMDGTRPEERDDVKRYVPLPTEVDIEMIRAATAKLKDPRYLGTPVLDEDGCYVYRGIHVSKEVANADTYMDIDRMIAKREGPFRDDDTYPLA